MPLEWIAIAAAAAPHLKKYAEVRADRLADSALAKAYRKLMPDSTILKVNEIFASRFGKELESLIDLAFLDGDRYQSALSAFLRNPTVQDVLQSPLDGSSELNWELLRGIWVELTKTLLPEGFDWARLAKAYRLSVQNYMLVQPDLRPILITIANIRSAEAGERIAQALEGSVRQSDFDLVRYATAIRTSFGFLKLGSLDSDWPRYQAGLRLTNVYIPQLAKEALPPRDLTRDYLRVLREDDRPFPGYAEYLGQLVYRQEEYSRIDSRLITEIVDDPANRYLVILGDPGLGKSTLLKSLALRWTESDRLPLALFIELRMANPDNGHRSFLDYLEGGPSQLCVLPKRCLHPYLKENDSMVLFDGLDEVTEPSRATVVDEIVRFSGDYPKARIIVTSRVLGYYPGSTYPETFRNARFRHYTLQDFTDDEIGRFITTWHREAFADPSDRNYYETRLHDAIDNSGAIHELAANPLLLTMMAILSRSHKLPVERGRLYERCAELLLKDWDLEKFPGRKGLGASDVGDTLGFEHKMRILERVAVAIQQEPGRLEGNLIAEEELKRIIEDELTLLGLPLPWSLSEHLIRILGDRSFMLAHVGDRQYAFVHRTFLEYFCARHLAYRLEKTSDFREEDLYTVYREHWREPGWHEVLRLLCGLIGVEYAGKSVEVLLALEREAGGHHAVLLAAECLAEASETGRIQDVRRILLDRLLQLISFDLPFFYEEFDSKAIEQVSSVRQQALHQISRIWRRDENTRRLLAAIAKSGLAVWFINVRTEDLRESLRVRALQELSRQWRDHPHTLSILKLCATLDLSPEVRGAAIHEVAAHWGSETGSLQWLLVQTRQMYWRARDAAVHEIALRTPDSPRTRIWLRCVANAAGDGTNRSSALRELVGLTRGDKSAREIALRQATRDSFSNVRKEAVTILARRWGDDPDTEAVLKSRAIKDISSDVRVEAIRMVSSICRSKPHCMEWLKSVAVDDKDLYVRACALSELGRGWADMPITMMFLQTRAQDDPAPSVRSSATVDIAHSWRERHDIFLWLQWKALHDPAEEVRSSCVKEISLPADVHPDAIGWLNRQVDECEFQDVQACAIEELSRGKEGDHAVFVWLKNVATTHRAAVVRATAIYEIARGWPAEPEIVDFLRAQAAIGSFDDVRRASIRALARGWRADPQSTAIIENSLRQDLSENVREASLIELTRVRDKEPMTERLSKIVCDDPASSVRMRALHELLARQQGELELDASLLRLLEEHCIRDSDSEVRARAVSGLSDLQRDRVNVKLLMDLAETDSAGEVVEAAVWALYRVEEPEEALVEFLRRSLENAVPGVRRAAMACLSRHSGDEPALISLLLRCAVQDNESENRISALEALSENWTDKSAMVHFMKSRLFAEQDKTALQTVVAILTRESLKGDTGLDNFVIEYLQNHGDLSPLV